MPLDSVPDEQLIDAHLLNPDATYFLYQIDLVSGTTMHLIPWSTVTWQGNTYSSTAIQVSGYGMSSSGKQSRPSMNIANIDGLYSSTVSAGNFDNATVTQYRVLGAHLDADSDIYTSRIWTIDRYSNLDHNVVTFELRGITDRQSFIMPSRSYDPPTFNSVSI